MSWGPVRDSMKPDPILEKNRIRIQPARITGSGFDPRKDPPDPSPILIMYAQEVVTLQKKYLIYLLQKLLRYFRLNIIRLQSKIILGQMSSMG